MIVITVDVTVVMKYAVINLFYVCQTCMHQLVITAVSKLILCRMRGLTFLLWMVIVYSAT